MPNDINYISKVKIQNTTYDIDASTVQNIDVVSELDSKIEKVSTATEGNIPIFDAEGSLVDGLTTASVQAVETTDAYTINVATEITAQASNLEIPTTKAVKDYIDALVNKLMEGNTNHAE